MRGVLFHMKKKTAYKIAVAAIEKEIRRTTSFEANLYERRISRTHSNLRAYNKRERFRRSISSTSGLIDVTRISGRIPFDI